MQVLCKIHHCSSGSEMAGVGRVLLHHFNTQGTPVMIGEWEGGREGGREGQAILYMCNI